jgi:hypothetical protein
MAGVPRPFPPPWRADTRPTAARRSSGDRKKRLARLTCRRRRGIVLSEHTADDGATIFGQACKMA